MKTIPIEGLEQYRATQEGLIYSLKTNKYLSSKIGPKGYRTIRLNGHTYCVHRLIALAYFKNKPGYQVNHKDFDKTNNAITNLELVHPVVNNRHSIARDTHGSVKLTQADRELIISLKASGLSVKDLSMKFNVHPTSIYNLLRGRTWSWL